MTCSGCDSLPAELLLDLGFPSFPQHMSGQALVHKPVFWAGLLLAFFLLLFIFRKSMPKPVLVIILSWSSQYLPSPSSADSMWVVLLH